MNDPGGASTRFAEDSDLDSILELNESAVPAMNSLSRDEMIRLAAMSPFLRVATVDSRIAGFLLVLEQGSAYESVNYRWFSTQFDRFAYIDRIVVAPWARRLGIARRLYEELESFAHEGGLARLCAEVNVRPRNEISLLFHEHAGFGPVGEQDTEGGAKRVVLLVKELASAGVDV